jgi:predicted SAM-dependent methyltransferase
MKTTKQILRRIIKLLYHKFSHLRLILLSRKRTLKIVIGASGVYQRGWIPTDIQHLNILRCEDWQRYFKPNSVDAILAEHVWEHLTLEEAQLAAKNCFYYLKTNGYIRVAVPDGFHPSREYIEYVKPGGTGLGSDDHKVLYTYNSLKRVFETAGFKISLLEYWDEKRQFHQHTWDIKDGLIHRSNDQDERNKSKPLSYTSIILDGVKPFDS